MAITALQITPDRSSVIDFSVPFLETGISILVAVRDGVISPMAFLGMTTITFVVVAVVVVVVVIYFLLFFWFFFCSSFFSFYFSN